MTNDETIQILDHLVSSLGKTLGQLSARIRSLESEGLTVQEGIDHDNDNAKVGTLAQHRNGLFLKTDDGWRCLSNGIDAVEAVPTPTGARLLFTRSTGDIFAGGEINLPKPTRRKAVKVVPK